MMDFTTRGILLALLISTEVLAASPSALREMHAFSSSDRNLRTNGPSPFGNANRIRHENHLDQYIVRTQPHGTPTILAELRAIAAGEFVRYIPHDAYLVPLEEEEVELVRNITGVESVDVVPSENKIAPRPSPSSPLPPSSPPSSPPGFGSPPSSPPGKSSPPSSPPGQNKTSGDRRWFHNPSVVIDTLLGITETTAWVFEEIFDEWVETLREESLGGSQVEVRWPSWDKVVIITDSTREDIIMEWLSVQPLVYWIEERPEFAVKNMFASKAIQSSDGTRTKLWEKGLLGDNEIVGCADTGLDHDSCFFRDDSEGVGVSVCEGVGAVPNCVNMGHRKVVSYRYFDGKSDTLDTKWGHGTHVVGSILGNAGPTSNWDEYTGAAPNAKVSFDDISPDGSSLWVTDDLNVQLFPHSYEIGARLHSNSWGSTTSHYTATAKEVDEFIYDHDDFLVLVAAGNDGPDLNTVGSPATAKNILAIGAGQNTQEAYLAYNPSNAEGKSFNNLVDFSSRGPTWDGRIKPDVVCPGDSIRSAYSDGDPASNQCYVVGMSGTSMATPLCAGSAALVRQYFKEGFHKTGAQDLSEGFEPSAALVKAVMIHSGQPMWFQDPDGNWQWPTSLPNREMGYGRVDLSSVLWFGDESAFQLLIFDRAEVSPGQTIEYDLNIASSSTPFKVTLVWTDPAGVPYSSRALIQNIDLHTTDPDGVVRYGNSWFSNGNVVVDDINNNEQITNYAPAVGTHRVTITGLDLPMGRQAFAVVITGATDTQAPEPETTSADPAFTTASPTTDAPTTSSSTTDAATTSSSTTAGKTSTSTPTPTTTSEAPTTTPAPSTTTSKAPTSSSSTTRAPTSSSTATQTTTDSQVDTSSAPETTSAQAEQDTTSAQAQQTSVAPTSTEEAPTTTTTVNDEQTTSVGEQTTSAEAPATTALSPPTSTPSEGCTWTAADGSPFSGSVVVSPVVAESGAMRVRFSSDEFTQRDGFLALYGPQQDLPEYTTVASEQTLSSVFGVVSDGAGDYLNNGLWWWNLAPEGASAVTIIFEEFNLETNYDFLYVQRCSDRECSNPEDVDGSPFTGSALPPAVTSDTGFMRLKLETDYSVRKPGFRAVFAGALSECGEERVVLTDGAGFIREMDGQYDNLMNCEWEIQATSAVELRFMSFHTAAPDSVEVDICYGSPGNEGGGGAGLTTSELEPLPETTAEAAPEATTTPSPTPPPGEGGGSGGGGGGAGCASFEPVLLSPFSGNDIPSPITSDESMLVRFVSDGSVVRDGFLALYGPQQDLPEYTTVASEQTLSSVFGVVSDGAGDYLNNGLWWWNLAPEGASAVTIIFEEFNLETNYDFLYVQRCSDRECSNPEDVDGSPFTGSALPPAVTSDTGFMRLKLETDYSVRKPGFRAVFAGALSECGEERVVLTDGAGFIREMDGQYDNLMNCEWEIQTATPIELRFLSFRTEAGWDVLEVETCADGAVRRSGQGHREVVEKSAQPTKGEESSKPIKVKKVKLQKKQLGGRSKRLKLEPTRTSESRAVHDKRDDGSARTKMETENGKLVSRSLPLTQIQGANKQRALASHVEAMAHNHHKNTKV